MTSGPDSMYCVPQAAFVGASQVGKSSLINRMVGEPILPTSGTGTPRSQAPCVFALPGLPVPHASTWQVSVEWIPPESARALVAGTGPRGVLIRRDLADERRAEFDQQLQAMLDEPPGPAWVLDLASGRDVSWLNGRTTVSSSDAQRLVGPLTGSWPSAVVGAVEVTTVGPATRLRVADLPGVGHDDVGGESTASWLRTHATHVDAIVCVIGQSGIGQALAKLLIEHWSKDELIEKLHLVSTYVDRLVDDPDSPRERAKAATTRCHLAADQIAALLRADQTARHRLLQRTYCVDARRANRWQTPVEFNGELQRLRADLMGVARPQVQPRSGQGRGSPR